MQIDEEEKNLRFLLSRIEGIGPMTFLKILTSFESIKKFKNADLNQCVELLGISKGNDIYSKLNILKYKNSFDKDFVVYGEDNYPQLLYQMTDPPIVLYYKGDISQINKTKTVTVVGTRKSTKYSEEILSDFISNLAKYNYAFASGLALGVDTIVHQYSLQNKALTFAVIGTSVDKIYPESNFNLAQKIISSGGVIISEYHPDDKVSNANFARRNRILAAMSKSTVVIEAPIESGALITAHLAFDYNREVYAFPSNVFAHSSKGNNKLIKLQKAQLIEDYSDFLYFHEKNDFVEIKKYVEISSLDNNEKKIIELLNTNKYDIDSIKMKFDIDTSKLLASLMRLEIKGMISKNEFDEYYTKVSIN